MYDDQLHDFFSKTASSKEISNKNQAYGNGEGEADVVVGFNEVYKAFSQMGVTGVVEIGEEGLGKKNIEE